MSGVDVLAKRELADRLRELERLIEEVRVIEDPFSECSCGQIVAAPVAGMGEQLVRLGDVLVELGVLDRWDVPR